MDDFTNECPICYSAYRQLKCLPCLHVFCQKCLQSHINNTAGDGLYFNCPMCRKQTLPIGNGPMPIAEWAESFATISQKQCPTHQGEILDIICKTCHVKICNLCCVGAHHRCKKTLTKYNAKKIRDHLSSRLHALKDELEPIEKRLVKLEQNFTGKQIRMMTDVLASFVVDHEKQWLDEIETTRVKEIGALQECKVKLDGIMPNIEENINDFESFISEWEEVSRGDDWPRIQCTHDYQPKQILTSTKTDSDQLKVEQVDFEINEQFVKIMDEMLKEDMVEKMPVQRTIISAANQIGSRLFLREMRSFLETPFVINDMIILRDNSVLIAEAGMQRIGKFSATGQRLRNAYFNSDPFSLCILRDDFVAVSEPKEKKIKILDCENLRENERFSFGKYYYGLASDDSARIFSLYYDIYTGNMYIDIISKNSHQSAYQIIHVVNLPYSKNNCYNYRFRVMPSSGHVIIINVITSLNVACIDLNGTVVFKYEGVSDHPLCSISDVAVSRKYIFVADKIANKIHRIKHNGNFVDIPLTSNDGISAPRKIAVNNENVLLILLQTNENHQMQLFSC